MIFIDWNTLEFKKQSGKEKLDALNVMKADPIKKINHF